MLRTCKKSKFSNGYNLVIFKVKIYEKTVNTEKGLASSKMLKKQKKIIWDFFNSRGLDHFPTFTFFKL